MKKKILLLISVFLVCFLFLYVINLGGKQMSAATKPVYYIITNPGEDASKTINVTWQSEESGSYLLYTFANDANFEKAFVIEPSEELWSTEGIKNTQPSNSFETHKRYVCKATIDDLNSATKYIYKIVSGKYNSETYHFTTAGLTNTWNFLAFTDFQCKNNNISHPLIRQMLDIGNNPNLVICSGDEIDTAGDESDWDWFFNKDETIFTNFIYASSPGDHEYWGASIDGKYPQYSQPWTYNKLFTYPQNGCAEAKNSNYYFYYNNVLFVSLDMGDSNTVSSTKIAKEAAWMKETIKKLEGTYQYLVVFDHKSIYGAYVEDSGVHKTITPQWYPIFDECNVDLVLSGHDHMYSRTYRLYNNKVTSSQTKGTYYLDMGSSGDKRRTTESQIVDDGLHEKTYDLKSLGISCGANIEVSPEKMVITVYDNNRNVRDKFTIKAKREPLDINCDGFNENEFFDNVNLVATGDHNGAMMINDSKNVGYVEKIEILDNGNECLNQNIDYNNIQEKYILNNVNSKKLNVKVTLKDGRNFEKNLDLDLGSLSNLTANFEDDEFYLSFKGKVHKIIDFSANLYIDDKLYKNITNDELNYGEIQLDLQYFHGNHKFVIKFENEGELISQSELNYINDEELLININLLDLKVGEEIKIEYVYKYEDLISLYSSNRKVIDVDGEGNVRANGPGKANIEIRILGINEPYIVNVNVKRDITIGTVIAIVASSVAVVSLGVLGFVFFKKRKLLKVK